MRTVPQLRAVAEALVRVMTGLLHVIFQHMEASEEDGFEMLPDVENTPQTGVMMEELCQRQILEEIQASLLLPRTPDPVFAHVPATGPGSNMAPRTPVTPHHPPPSQSMTARSTPLVVHQFLQELFTTMETGCDCGAIE